MRARQPALPLPALRQLVLRRRAAGAQQRQVLAALLRPVRQPAAREQQPVQPLAPPAQAWPLPPWQAVP